MVLPSGIVVPDCRFDRPVPAPIAPATKPVSTGGAWVLMPGSTCSLVGDHLSVSFDLLPDAVWQENGRTWIARTRRTVDVELDAALLACLVDGLMAGRTWTSLAQDLPSHARDPAHDLLVDLTGWGAVVEMADARSRLSHAWSMRGARGRGRLSPAAVADLTFAPRSHRDEPGGAVVPLPAVRPFPSDSLAAVLRGRRSPTRYDASSISVDELGQLLGGACGVTGELRLGDRAVPLRAYPSPGALYAVDVHVVPARVAGLAPGVFRYDAAQHALVAVHDRPVDPASFCLPDVRAVVTGVAAFIALTVCLSRATSKYGDESYRILVAEAGCIAQNLVLVAHAVGLRAGPFTGVFDALVDQAVGMEPGQAGFVVGVLVGREVPPA
jgi:SagB-type dehydrogenase family enzyme